MVWMSNFSGDRKYKIQVLDPFDVEELKILNDGPRPTGISITLKNAKVYGLKNIVMKKAMWVWYDYPTQVSLVRPVQTTILKNA